MGRDGRRSRPAFDQPLFNHRGAQLVCEADDAGEVGGGGLGAIYLQIPGVAATVQTYSARFRSRQKSPTLHASDVGGPFSVLRLPFW